MSPDLLSPYGEGYCGRCQFIVGLTFNGKLMPHARGVTLGVGKPCPGSCRKPWKRTPYACRKNIFRIRVPHIECPQCLNSVPVKHSPVAGTRVAWHLKWRHGIERCPGAGAIVKDGAVVPAK